MEKLQIEYIDINKLVPYENNTKRHTKKQIEHIISSIQKFGMIDPIGIDENNMILEGHGRLEALKQIKAEKVPCIRITGLSEEEKKAYNITHNFTNKETGFNEELLFDEISSFDDINMSDFGINIDKLFDKAFVNTSATKTQEQVENILNLGKAQYEGVGKYDIPEILPVYELPEIKEWIGFNYVLSDDNPEGKAVHFFIDDYQFERIWNNPDKYIEKLKKYVCVTSPDFSPYGDMPLATQIYNHYRKHWIGRYLQEKGVTVIPTIRSSTDSRSKEWYLDGEPKRGIVCISSMWATREEIKPLFIEEYNTMMKKLKPKKVLLYGKMVEGIEGNIERIENFTEKRWNK